MENLYRTKNHASLLAPMYSAGIFQKRLIASFDFVESTYLVLLFFITTMHMDFAGNFQFYAH